MMDTLVGRFAPHICESCGATGSTLCNCCNKDILAKLWIHCIACLQPIDPKYRRLNGAICASCRRRLPFRRVFVVGERSGVLQRLVGNFKYLSRRDSARSIANLLASALPDDVPDDMNIVFVPTSPKHIRERGFDHMKLVAQALAKERHLLVQSIIKRINNQAQHSANRAKRLEQTRSAFELENRSVPERILLIDDIYTTGTTVQTIAKLLRQAGAKEVWLAIVARQRMQ